MKILEILGAPEKEVTTEAKLKAVTDLVGKVRKVYGNTDAEIPAVKVGSTNGMVSVNLLTTGEKVAVAEQEIRKCIAQATIVAENTKGAVFDRAFEAAVATSAILANINAKSDSAY